jgi:hypothetical protein
MKDNSDMSHEDALAMCFVSPKMHFETCAKIQDAFSKKLMTPTANAFQQKIYEAFEVLTAIGHDCIRIIATKPRQCGGTTSACHIIYHMCRKQNTDALIIADVAANSQGILDRLKVYSSTDLFPWGSTLDPRETRLRFTNGSTVTISSANTINAGISKPRQAVLFSESAKYPRGGVLDCEKILASVLPSLNDSGCVIMESTPAGASGAHYNRWVNALPLDEFVRRLQAGDRRPGNNFVKVFVAWFEFPENSTEVTPEMMARIDATLTPREIEGKRSYNWSHAQIAWRRSILSSECGNSEDLFDEYYPEDSISCFLSSGRPRFNAAGLNRIEQMISSYPPACGSLVDQGENTVFQPDPSGYGSIQIWEKPREGCRYLVWCDPMTGEDQTGSNDPDRHSIGVLRTEFFEAGGAFFRDAVVARVRPPFTGTTQLTADYITMLSQYYGDAMVVLEVNMGLHILERLKDSGVPLYKREIVDPYDRENRRMAYGWKLSDRDQRRGIIDSLALALSNSTLDFWCPNILSECRTFIIDRNGKEIARSGCKDDDVLGLAMAVFCKGSATLMAPRRRIRKKPADWRRWDRR